MYEYTIQILAQQRGYSDRYSDWKDYWSDIIRRVNDKIRRSGIDNLKFTINHFQEFDNVEFDSVGNVQSDFRIILEVAEDKKNLKAFAYYLGEDSKKTDKIAMLHYSATPEIISSLILHEIGHSFGCGFPEIYNQRTTYGNVFFESKWCGDAMDYVGDDESFNELHAEIIRRNIDQSKPATWLKDAVVDKYYVKIIGNVDGKPEYMKNEKVKYYKKPVARVISRPGYIDEVVFISLAEIYWSYLKGEPEHVISVELKKTKKEPSKSFELPDITTKEVLSMEKLKKDFGVRALLATLIIGAFSIAYAWSMITLIGSGDIQNAIELSRPVGTITGMILSFYFGTRAGAVSA